MLDAASGVLAFTIAPDFDEPGDADRDDVYHLILGARNAAGVTAINALDVFVTNVNGVHVTGDQLGDTITGTAEDDTLNGAGGDDALLGLGGPDMLSGGEGDDMLFGGDGNDSLVGNGGDDLLVVRRSRLAHCHG